MKPSRFLVLLALTTVGLGKADAAWHRGSQAIMGTRIDVELWHEDPSAARVAIDAVMEEMHRIDRLMSTYRDDSELSRVNQSAAESAVEVSPELFDLLAYSLELSELTAGAFDISYASVGYLYDYRERQRPEQAAIDEALRAVDYHLVELDREQCTVHFAREGVRVDLGGIAKGHAVDRGIALLRERGIENGIVTAGGDSRILGDRRGKPWIIGIQDPRASDQIAVRIPLVNEAISTSGDYERYFEEDGIRYHHIISPETGDSAREVFSATIIGPRAVQTDGLSTSVFVLGVEKGLELIDSLTEVEGVIIDSTGRLYYSSGLTDPTTD